MSIIRDRFRLFRESAFVFALCLIGFAFIHCAVVAHETCQFPYMAKTTGQEEFIYVWTLGMEGLGDGSDKLVTVDVRPNVPTYGKVINSVSIGGRHEAHHSGFSDDRHYLWVAGLENSEIFIFDVYSDPSKPKLHVRINDFVKYMGGADGPNTFYAMPGRVMISALSNDKNKSGVSALVEHSVEGKFLSTQWDPKRGSMGEAKVEEVVDGYNYDTRVQPQLTAMLTSSFTGRSNDMMDFGKMPKDPLAMKRFRNSVTVWDRHTRKPRKVMRVRGAPLEVGWVRGSHSDYAFTSTALTSQLWLLHMNKNGEWQSEAVADIGDPKEIHLPVDMSISADDKELWVNTFLDGTTRLFDISNPFAPKQIYEKKIGAQVNMVSQSWDGKRVYYSTSLLPNWDKKGKDNEQFVKAYDWDGKELKHRFTIDFIKEKLGRAHLMKFGSSSLYGG
jgi:methanethiol oxidase